MALLGPKMAEHGRLTDGPKRSKRAQNDPKWSKTCYIDHLGSFWTLLDRFGTSASLPCLAIFGPKRTILDLSAHMIEGW